MSHIECAACGALSDARETAACRVCGRALCPVCRTALHDLCPLCAESESLREDGTTPGSP